MPLRSISILALLLCHCAVAQITKQHRDLDLLVTNDGQHFQYWIAHPERVKKAWIEVLDRPVVVDKKEIEASSGGEFDWEWNWDEINAEMDEDKLELGLWDPDDHTLTCDGLAIYAQPGGEASKTVAGGRTSFDPWPELDQKEVRVPQGGPDFSLDVTGTDLAPGTKLHVFSEKDAQCKDEFVRTEVLDLSHAKVTIARECFRQSGLLYLSATSDTKPFNSDNVWIDVASRTSPKLKSVSSAPIDEKQRLKQLSFVVRGSNFKRDSSVVANYMPIAGINGPQVFLDTKYVSPTELRASVNTDDDDSVGETLGLDHTGVVDSYSLRIWVQGDKEKLEISDPRELKVQLDPSKRRRLAQIASIEPFPVRLMNEHSERELKITIRGENFIRQNKVMAHYGVLSETLRTEYVSPTELRAWIPREHWRKHHVLYRLVVETDKGRKYSRQVGSKDDEQ